MTTRLAEVVEAFFRPDPLFCVGCGISVDPYQAMGLPDGAVVCRVSCGMRYWRWAHESWGARFRDGKPIPSQAWPIRRGRLD